MFVGGKASPGVKLATSLGLCGPCWDLHDTGRHGPRVLLDSSRKERNRWMIQRAFQVQKNQSPKYRMWEAGSQPVLCKRSGTAAVLTTRSIEACSEMQPRTRGGPWPLTRACWAEAAHPRPGEGQPHFRLCSPATL